MPTHLVKPPPRSQQASSKSHPTFSIHQDIPSDPASGLDEPTDTDPLNGGLANRTLAPTSWGAINSMKPSTTVSATRKSIVESSPHAGLSPLNNKSRMVSTIRSVPSFEAIASDTSSDTPSTTTKNSAFSSSTNSTDSMASHDETTPAVKLKDSQMYVPRRDSNRQLPNLPSNSLLNHAFDSHTPSLSALPAADPASSEDAAPSEQPASQPWDSTIGKAGLGKTGRVINKLVSDNESLRRDLKIERLRAEESRQAAKLTEDKMERLISDYESRLLEASVTKTLLSRKERQVESLTAAVELERKRAKDALERERTWREEMEKTSHDAKARVEEASNYAQMMEGRYNAISSHWRDQGEEAKRAVAKLRGEITTLVQERRDDDEKIATLGDLCDQQDSNIKMLQHQKTQLEEQFEAYKQEQEDQLRDIKTLAKAREEEQTRLLDESREALNKLRWALNVKNNVEGAQ